MTADAGPWFIFYRYGDGQPGIQWEVENFEDVAHDLAGDVTKYGDELMGVVSAADAAAAPRMREALRKIAKLPSRTPSKARAQQIAHEACDIARAALEPTP